MFDWLQLMAGSNIGLCKYDNEKLCGLKSGEYIRIRWKTVGFSGRILCRNLVIMHYHISCWIYVAPTLKKCMRM